MKEIISIIRGDITAKDVFIKFKVNHSLKKCFDKHLASKDWAA